MYISDKMAGALYLIAALIVIVFGRLTYMAYYQLVGVSGWIALILVLLAIAHLIRRSPVAARTPFTRAHTRTHRLIRLWAREAKSWTAYQPMENDQQPSIDDLVPSTRWYQRGVFWAGFAVGFVSLIALTLCYSAVVTGIAIAHMMEAAGHGAF